MFRKIWKQRLEASIDDEERKERKDAYNAWAASGVITGFGSLAVWSSQNESSAANIALEHYASYGIFVGAVLLTGAAAGYGIDYWRENRIIRESHKFPTTQAQFDKQWGRIRTANVELEVAFASRIEDSVAFMALPEDLE